MNATTFSLHQFQSRPTLTDTAQDTIRALQKMSTQTKQRLENLALLLGLMLTIASAVKVFVFLPTRVETLEKSDEAQAAKIDAMELKASATDVAIAGIMPQLSAINQGLLRIESDVRELRRAAAP